jgi:hypothetical protein
LALVVSRTRRAPALADLITDECLRDTFCAETLDDPPDPPR